LLHFKPLPLSILYRRIDLALALQAIYQQRLVYVGTRGLQRKPELDVAQFVGECFHVCSQIGEFVFQWFSRDVAFLARLASVRICNFR
jgi:hypothetical protein